MKKLTDSRIVRGEKKFIAKLCKALNLLKIRKMKENKETIQEGALPEKVVREIVGKDVAVQGKVIQEDTVDKQIRMYIAVPVLFIFIAELLIFFGRIWISVLVYIGVLFALTLFNIFVKDLKVHKIHMPLLLLPVFRLVNLSMPIFSEVTLYSFIFYYTALAIPVLNIIIHQRDSFKEIGITKKHLLTYVIIAIPLSFLLGLGEYLIIWPENLIPNYSFENLLMLTIIMVFFVGLVEELLFRSILQSRLEKTLSLPETLLITSLLFGCMHSSYGTYYEMLYICFVGFVIGFIFHKTKSLPFVAVVHGFINVFLLGILPLYSIYWK